MEDEYTDEEIKTFFKLSKRLVQHFEDTRHLATKFLLKINKIKVRKQEAAVERAEKNKKAEMQKKKREKMEGRKIRIEKEKAEKQKQLQAEKKRKAQEPIPQKSIISIIRPDKVKSKQNKKQSKKNTSSEKRAEDQKQENEKKAERVQEDKPMEKPVLPLEPYYRFLSTKRNQIKSTTANISMAETSRILKAVWQKMSDEQKRPFVEGFMMDKAKYERDMIAYYQPRRGKQAEARRKQQQQKQKKKQKETTGIDFMEELAKM